MENITFHHSNRKTIETWSDDETTILLNKYDELFPSVGPLGTFKTKKEMFMHIADCDELQNYNKTWEQCQQRYKTILRRTKKSMGILSPHNTSSRSRERREERRIETPLNESLQKIEHFEQKMDKYFELMENTTQPETEPEPLNNSLLNLRQKSFLDFMSHSIPTLNDKQQEHFIDEVMEVFLKIKKQHL